MNQITKEDIIKKIKNREIKNSRGVFKFLNENDLFDVNNSYGKTRTEKLYNWLYEIKKKEM